MPFLALVAVLIHIDGEVGAGPDAGVFIGLSENVHRHGSLTSPTNPGWLLMSPAEAAARRGFIPIPDFAPLYPSLGAATGDPLVAYTVIALASVWLALAATGGLVALGSGSTAAGIAAQLMIVFGPVAKLSVFPLITFLDTAAFIQSDILAMALLLAALCAIVWSAGAQRMAAVAAGGLLLAASSLTRFAYAGAALGVALVLLLVWWRSRLRDDRSRLLAAAVAVLAVPVWVVGYRLVTRSGPGKIVSVHPAALNQIGRVALGWIGVSSTSKTLDRVALVGVVVTLVVVALRSRNSLWMRLCSGAAIGYLAVHIFTVDFLDASYSFASERTLLPLRVLVIVMATGTVARWCRRSPTVWRPIVVGALAAGWVIVLGGHTFEVPFVAARGPTLNALNPAHLPMLASSGDQPYVQTRRPIVELPTAREASTGEPRSIRRQAKQLVEVLQHQASKFMVLEPQGGPAQIMTRSLWPGCVRTRSVAAVDGIERYVLTLDECRRGANDPDLSGTSRRSP